MAISEQVEQMDREDLEDLAITQHEQLQQFADRLDEVESMARAARDTAFELEDAVTGDVGSFAATQLADDQGSILDRVEDLERGEVTVSDVIDAGASDSELQIQRWRADVKEADHPDDVSGLTKNQARSTELWAYFYDLADKSHGKLKLTRRNSSKIFSNLSDYNLPTDRNTVNRCMRFMARATGPTDDEENDDHLVTFKPGDEGSQSVLVADQDEFEQFAAEITGVETPDRDRDVDLTRNPDAAESGGEPVEADDATEDVAEDSMAFMDAEPVTSASEDTVTQEHGMENDAPTAREL